MKYLSVCSGIEAASVAWHPLGWEPVAFSEIDPFASAVLAARFPHVPNLGNMEAYREWSLPPFDVLVGGTPCQSFSVAGLRKGLDDPRGNLALVYLGILERFRPRWCVWENVPGVLSSSGGRDFGAFLGGLAQLGYGFAHRVLDAQFVRVESHPRAVPQRRRRVFVVGHSGGDWRSAAAVLLEPEGVRGDSPPRREAGKDSPRNPRAGAEGRSGEAVDAPSFSWPVEVADPISAHERGTYTHEGTTFRLHNVVPDVVAFQSNLGSQGGWNESEVGATVRAQESPNKADTLIAAPTSAIGFATSGLDSMKDDGASPPLKAMLNGQRTGAGPSALVATTMAVRRLTPRECERLQGFPDEWTAITYRGKPASDGPRYKALGNSMAVNVMRWVGERLSLVAEREEDETYMAITEQSPALFTAGTVEWNTPQVVIDALLRGWGSIALDPCANEASIVPASLRLMLPTPERAAQPAVRGVRLEDGLAFDWDAVGPRLVYVNPPFGLKGDAGALPWLVKAAAAQVAEVVLLLPARTDTVAFHEHVFGRCDAICFWQGRLRFSGARDPAPFPSVFLYWGSSPEKFNAAFAPHGKVILQP